MNLATLALPPWARIAIKLAPWVLLGLALGDCQIDRGRLQTNLAKGATTIERLSGAVRAQNLAMDALNRQQVEASATREAAHAAQQEAERRAAGVRSRLEAYKRPADGTACPNPTGDALASEMWGRL